MQLQCVSEASAARAQAARVGGNYTVLFLKQYKQKVGKKIACYSRLASPLWTLTRWGKKNACDALRPRDYCPRGTFSEILIFTSRRRYNHRTNVMIIMRLAALTRHLGAVATLKKEAVVMGALG